MQFKININDDKTEKLTPEAVKTLEQQAGVFCQETLEEALRIEEGSREDDAVKEITSSIIVRAVKKRNIAVKKSRPWWRKLLKLLSIGSSGIAGAMFDKNGYNGDKISFYIFLVALCIAIITTVLDCVIED